MNTQHTPGPWWMAASAGTLRDTYSIGAGYEELAHGIKSRTDALTMKAAPELLANLEQMVKTVRDYQSGRLVTWPASVLPQADAAIAAAKGGA